MAVNAVQLYVPGQVPGDPAHDDGDFERRRREARARLAEAMKGRPIQHWTQGLHQMSEAALAGYDEHRARQDAKEQRAAMADIMTRMYGGGQGGQGSGSVGGSVGPNIPAAAMKPPAPPAPTPNTGPIPNDIAQAYGIPGATFDMPGRGQPTEYPAPAPPPPVAASSGGQDPMYDEGMQAYEAMLAQPPAPVPEPPGPPPETQGYNAMGDFMPPPPGPQSAAPPPPKPPMPQQMADNSPMIARMSEILARDQQPLPQQAPPQQVNQRMVQSQPMPQPMASAPSMDPSAMGGQPPRDLSARVPSPGMMAPVPQQMAAPLPVIPPPQPAPQGPAPKGMMGLGAQLPAVDGVTTSVPPGVSTEAPPASADLQPLDIKDLTGGLTRGPGGQRDPSGIQRIIAHDVAGNIAPENLAKYSQTNKGYHYAVDRNTGQVYQLQKPEALAYHAKGGNSDSLGVAMTGFEGQPTSPKALASMNQLLMKLGKDHNIPPERMLTHPGVQQGKHAKEADWLPAALAYKQQQGGAATAAAPPAVDPSKASGMIQMAQNGPGMTKELFKELALRNPMLAQQLMMQDMQRQQNAPDKELDRRKTESEIRKNEAQAGQYGQKQDYGTTPPGYRRVEGKDGRPSLERIPGGPPDEKQVLRQQGDEKTLGYSMQSMNELQRAASEVLSMPGLEGNFGIKGALPNIPGGDAANAKAALETLKTKVGFGALQAMRDASKTGGALGSITEGEHRMLAGSMAALDKAQSYEQVQKSLQDIVRQVEESKGRMQYHFNRTYGGGADQNAVPPNAATPWNGPGYGQQGGADAWAGAFPGTGGGVIDLGGGVKMKRLN